MIVCNGIVDVPHQVLGEGEGGSSPSVVGEGKSDLEAEDGILEPAELTEALAEVVDGGLEVRVACDARKKPKEAQEERSYKLGDTI